ncbi:hypothetical protein DRP05_03915 [Archaeoglobales archaeon]|nr:MAG: hypothetical protein DRP05_03915 [Archaeoglobales archaeon]
MMSYDFLLEEMKKEIGPIAKIFLDRVMNALGLTEINDTNYKEVLDLLKKNEGLREYIENIESRI